MSFAFSPCGKRLRVLKLEKSEIKQNLSVCVYFSIIFSISLSMRNYLYRLQNSSGSGWPKMSDWNAKRRLNCSKQWKILHENQSKIRSERFKWQKQFIYMYNLQCMVYRWNMVCRLVALAKALANATSWTFHMHAYTVYKHTLYTKK